MRTIRVVLIIAVLLATNPAKAEECRPLVKSVSIESSIRTGYLSAFGVRYSHNPVGQTSYTVTLCNGLYANLWHSLDLKSGPNNGSGDEIDATVGWSGNLGSSGFTLDLGVTHQNIPPVSRLGKEDYVSPYLELTAPEQELGKHRLAPYVRLEVYRDMARGQTANFQPFVYLGAKHEWMLDDVWSVSQKVYGLHNPKALDLHPAFVSGYNGALKYKLGETATAHVPLVQMTIPLGNVRDGRKFETVVGLGISLTF